MDHSGDVSDEMLFLDGLAVNYDMVDESSQARLMRDLLMRVVTPYVNGGVALELGCEAGYMTARIASVVDRLDVVDGSEQFLEEARQRNIPGTSYYHSLFEEFEPETEYDYVFASHVLEHVIDVRAVLAMVRKALKPEGYLFAFVPNARAMSRQLARRMGLVESLYHLTPNDLKGGHRRVYDMALLVRDLESSGFRLLAQGGVLLKPFADFQMEKLLDTGILGPLQCEGLFRLGCEYPDMCADVYAIGVPGE